MRPGRIASSDIRVLVDDTGVDLTYAPAQFSARLYEAGVDRLRTLPAQLATAGRKKLLERPALERPKLPKAPAFPATGRTLALADLKAYAPFPSDRAQYDPYIGRHRDGYRLVQTDGKAAVLEHDGQPGADLRVAVPHDAPVWFVATPVFWQAVARVRTCRHSVSDSLYLDSTADTVRVRAWEGALEAPAFYACETVPVAEARPLSLTIADAYLWPLRGTVAVFRTTGEVRAPVFASGFGPLSVVLMPMRV